MRARCVKRNVGSIKSFWYKASYLLPLLNYLTVSVITIGFAVKFMVITVLFCLHVYISLLRA
uniref:Uncharacterized protein n=1 Tax=Arundo donax TaxID=35708 RepID=A0A0A8ZX70_ARUDO